MIAVFNGANLNMLGQRDPSQYGTLTLSELESRVYAWAGELNLTARCHQSKTALMIKSKVEDGT
jgi:3-dehydroquinate dehydratase-2